MRKQRREEKEFCVGIPLAFHMNTGVTANMINLKAISNVD